MASELERLERVMLEVLAEVREERRELRTVMIAQTEILKTLQEIFGELEPPTEYPASTGASLSVT